jgi:FkbM family methyltransferase
VSKVKEKADGTELIRHFLYRTLVPMWPVRRGKGRWAGFLSDMLRISHSNLLQRKTFGRYRLLLNPTDANDRLYYFKIAGRGYSTLLSRLLRRGDVVIDVGANVGHFSAISAELLEYSGRVLAVEASPILFERLRASVLELPNGPIEPYHFAIWSKSEPVTFNLATVSGWSSLLENPTYQTAAKVQVEAITLDELFRLANIRHARLLKLDIEGAELDALLGATQMLADRTVDFLLIEAEPYRLRAFRHNGEDLSDLMFHSGYVPICAIESERVTRLSEQYSVPGSFNGDLLYAVKALSGPVLKSIFCTHRSEPWTCEKQV